MRMRIEYGVLVAMALTAGCATPQDLASMRQDIQKEVQDVRAQGEAKQKTIEESQVRLSKGLEGQADAVAKLSARVQEMQGLQESLRKERTTAQGATAALRDAILRSLKAEQSDLQQRAKAVADYIKEIERAGLSEAVPVPSSAAGHSEKSLTGKSPAEKGAAEGLAPKDPGGPQSSK